MVWRAASTEERGAKMWKHWWHVFEYGEQMVRSPRLIAPLACQCPKDGQQDGDRMHVPRAGRRIAGSALAQIRLRQGIDPQHYMQVSCIGQ